MAAAAAEEGKKKKKEEEEEEKKKEEEEEEVACPQSKPRYFPSKAASRSFARPVACRRRRVRRESSCRECSAAPCA